MEITVTKEQDGMLLRDFLRYRLGASHRLVTRLKRDPEGILLDGAPVTVRAVLKEGQRLSLAIADITDGSESVRPSAEAWSRICHRIVYEDDRMIALNKPPLMPTHPSHGHSDDSLASGLCYRAGQAGEPFVCRAVNRLDRDTSGLVLLAKDQLSAFSLASQIASGQVEKRYIAILRGVLPQPGSVRGYDPCPADSEETHGRLCRIATRFRRTADSIITREVTFMTDGIENSEAITLFRPLSVLEREGQRYTAVLCTPVTGRTHQLRVHFAYLGCPLVGDTLYGPAEQSLPRQALHAGSLTLLHPVTKEQLSLFAPLPEDMRALLGEQVDAAEAALRR